MKFGMFTSGYQRLPLEKCFTDAAQLGYDYIELWGGYPHAFAPDVIEDYREIRRLQEHYGIPVPVYTPEHNAYPSITICWGRKSSGAIVWRIWRCLSVPPG